jgi:hypothetical protein
VETLNYLQLPPSVLEDQLDLVDHLYPKNDNILLTHRHIFYSDMIWHRRHAVQKESGQSQDNIMKLIQVYGTALHFTALYRGQLKTR